tara:strand:- start:264 stop:482 length:219 start_codon:yes stop_codon:yes gene_type:complete
MVKFEKETKQSEKMEELFSPDATKEELEVEHEQTAKTAKLIEEYEKKENDETKTENWHDVALSRFHKLKDSS